MYNIIRKIHLYCGMILLIFLMMYFVSGYMMAHRPWFLGKLPAPKTQTVPIDVARELSREDLADDVKHKLSLAGRIQFPEKQPADLTRFWVNRPGWMVRVEVPMNQRQATITSQPAGFVGTLIMLHKIAGYDDEPVFDAYALFCDLSGLSMILFALSGVYLWWKRVRNHALGVVCLIVSLGYAVGMLLYFSYAP